MKHTNLVLALSLAALLAGCGGGGSSGKHPDTGKEPDTGAPSATRTGKFIDAPVQGLSYIVTPSDNPCNTAAAGCVTDVDGTFKYNPGDRVAFSLGGQELGEVVAQDVVTPQTVAEAVVAGNPSADVETVRNNLLVFLQTLDADGDPSNGITINSEVAKAILPNAVDFTADAAAFDAELDKVVVDVMAATGEKLVVVDRNDAIDHFNEQLQAQLIGTFVWADEAFNPVTENTRTLTFLSNGTYLYGGHDGDPCDGDAELPGDDAGNGSEFGEFAYDPAAKTLSFSKTRESNGCGGPETEEGEFWEVAFDGNRLTLTMQDEEDGEDVARFVRVTNIDGQVSGSWLLPFTALNREPVVMSFFPATADGSRGRYFLADSRLADMGIEEGCYSIGAGGAVSFDANPGGACPSAIDTNGEDGFNGLENTTINVDAHGRLVLTEDEDDGEFVVTFMRLTGGALSLKDFAGAWTFEVSPGVAPAAEAELFVLLINPGDGENGTFVFGTQHNNEDPDECTSGTYRSYEQELHGNGIEAGRLVLLSNGGVVMPMIDMTTSGVDTNGECGLFNVDSPIRFIFRHSKATDALLVWSSDDGEEDQQDGLVFRRAPVQADSVVGLWHSGTPEAREKESVLFLPGGHAFTMRWAEASDSGIRREAYTVSGNKVTLTTAGFDDCVDTIDDLCEFPEEVVLVLDAEWQTATHDSATDPGMLFKAK